MIQGTIRRPDREPSPGDCAVEADLAFPEFQAIASILQSDARIALAPTKSTLVHSRLSRRLRARGLNSFADYVKLVRSDAEERSAMVVSLTTNHTHFFRESHHFDHLSSSLVPALRSRDGPIRIWSAGCSSGEEAYSIAMCLHGPDRAGAAWLRKRDVRLLATDLAPHAVKAARRGIYSEQAVRPVPGPFRSAWLKSAGADFEVDEELRKSVTARVLNLFGPWPMRHRYDAIFCRNVMIYFDDESKAELERRFADLLVPGGFLYIGHSERLIGEAARVLRPAGHTIYRKDRQ